MSNVTITGSSIGTLQACAEKYRLRFLVGLEAFDRPAYFSLGSAFHRGVEAMRKGGSLCDALNAVAPDAEKLSDDDVCVLTVMLEVYCMTYRYKGEEFSARGSQWAEIEYEFSKKLAPDVTIAGVVDAILKQGNPGGQTQHVIYETKTAARIDGTYLERLWCARQTLIYTWILNELGFDVVSTMYDIIQKPSIRRLKATPEEKKKYVTDKKTGLTKLYAKQRECDESDIEFLTRLRVWYQDHPDALHREEVVYTAAQLGDIEKDIRSEVKRLQWHIQSGIWPRSLGSCYMYNTPCEFVPLCRSGGNPIMLETHYKRREKLHPELSLQGEDK